MHPEIAPSTFTPFTPLSFIFICYLSLPFIPFYVFTLAFLLCILPGECKLHEREPLSTLFNTVLCSASHVPYRVPATAFIIGYTPENYQSYPLKCLCLILCGIRFKALPKQVLQNMILSFFDCLDPSLLTLDSSLVAILDVLLFLQRRCGQSLAP